MSSCLQPGHFPCSRNGKEFLLSFFRCDGPLDPSIDMVRLNEEQIDEALIHSLPFFLPQCRPWKLRAPQIVPREINRVSFSAECIT